MNMKIGIYRSLLLSLTLCCCLGACASERPNSAELAVSSMSPVGDAGRDIHGCIVSTGYSWCTNTSQCERPWELAAKYGFENNPQAFKGFCEAKK